MVKDKDFDEPLRDFKLRVARVYAYNLKEPNAELHMETPERWRHTQINSSATLALLYSVLGRSKESGEFTEVRSVAVVSGVRAVKDLLDAHVSIYAANKALGMGKSINKLKDWANNGAIVDDNGQPYIKSGKVIEGWKR